MQSIELSTGVARSSVSVSPVGSLRYGIGLRNVLGHEADTIINYEFGFQTEATQLKIGYDDQTSPFSFILDNRWYLEDVASSWAFFLSGGTGVSSTGGIDLRLGLGSTYHFNDNWGMVAQLELSTLVLRPYSELFVGLVGARYTF